MPKIFYKIYSATHPTLGEYIGFTKSPLGTRKTQHHAATRRGSTTLLHNALRDSDFSGWTWSAIGWASTKAEAGKIERNEINSREPKLNTRFGGEGGGQFPADFSHGGYQNRGTKASRATRAKLRQVRQRPRKRKFDRQKMLALSDEGVTQEVIAEILGCNQALVSQVVSGKLKP